MSIWRRTQRERFARLRRRRARRIGQDDRAGAEAFGSWSMTPPAPSQTPSPGDGPSPRPPSTTVEHHPTPAKDPDWQPNKQTIQLTLLRPQDMFEVSQTDLFSEYRNFLSGVEFCISELKARFSRRPVRLEIKLPPAEIDDTVGDSLAQTLRRYCMNRIRYNRRETRSLRFSGISALRVGVPVSALGFLMVGAATDIHPATGADHVIVDHLGWVLLWLGLWFPLDEFFFYPLVYGRESRVLRLLYDAEVVIEPYLEPPDELLREPTSP